MLLRWQKRRFALPQGSLRRRELCVCPRPPRTAAAPRFQPLPACPTPGAPPLPAQAQFYAHGLGMNPAERKFRLGAAVAMEAAVLLLLAAEHRK